MQRLAMPDQGRDDNSLLAFFESTPDELVLLILLELSVLDTRAALWVCQYLNNRFSVFLPDVIKAKAKTLFDVTVDRATAQQMTLSQLASNFVSNILIVSSREKAPLSVGVIRGLFIGIKENDLAQLERLNIDYGYIMREDWRFKRWTVGLWCLAPHQSPKNFQLRSLVARASPEIQQFIYMRMAELKIIDRDWEEGTLVCWAIICNQQLPTQDSALLMKSDNDNWSPLDLAAELGRETHVEQLLKLPEVLQKIRENGNYNPLASAAEGGHLVMVDRLLPFILDEPRRQFAFGSAAAGGHMPVLQRLRPLIQGIPDFAIHSACQSSPNTSVIDYLVEQGADVNFATDDYKTPLMCAISDQNYSAVLRLLECEGVNVNVDCIGLRTALCIAVYNAVSYQAFNILDALLSRSDLEINLASPLGYLITLFKYRADTNTKTFFDVMKRLLNRGATPNNGMIASLDALITEQPQIRDGLLEARELFQVALMEAAPKQVAMPLASFGLFAVVSEADYPPIKSISPTMGKHV